MVAVCWHLKALHVANFRRRAEPAGSLLPVWRCVPYVRIVRITE